jgi:hypothetical protein
VIVTTVDGFHHEYIVRAIASLVKGLTSPDLAPMPKSTDPVPVPHRG